MMRSLSVLFLGTVLILPLGACGDDDPFVPPPDPGPDPDPEPVIVEATGVSEPGEHRLELSHEEVPTGWVTLRFENTAEDTEHFAVMARLPEGVTVEDYPDGVNAFQEFLDALNRGEDGSDIAFPEWMAELVQVGGAGITAPGGTSETTLYLEPGDYVIECYMKTDAAQFHSFLGMFVGLTVTEEESNAPEPGANLELRVTNSGFQVEGTPGSGEQTVAVHFDEQQFHGNGVQHDVQLVRIDAGTDLEELGRWMNWLEPIGLIPPAPGQFEGGAQEMPVGGTAYFRVDLEAGDYAWIAEVDDPESKGMLIPFTVD